MFTTSNLFDQLVLQKWHQIFTVCFPKAGLMQLNHTQFPPLPCPLFFSVIFNYWETWHTLVMLEHLQACFNSLLFNYFSVIGRCEYGKTCSLLVQLFDQAAQAYQEMISSVNISKIEATIQEGRLTWLVYIIGAAVGGRVSFNRYYFEKLMIQGTPYIVTCFVLPNTLVHGGHA